MAGKVKGYSATQIGLHWAVVVLVAFQFMAHASIERSWVLYLGGEETPPVVAIFADLHVVAGILIFMLALARIYLRITRGTPPPPPDEPKLQHLTAEAVHGLIYVLLLVLPLTGAVAWFLGLRAPAELHSWLTNLLLGAIVLHVGGALFQHVVRRSQIMVRMLAPERTDVHEAEVPMGSVADRRYEPRPPR